MKTVIFLLLTGLVSFDNGLKRHLFCLTLIPSDSGTLTLIAIMFYFSKVPAFLNVVDIAGLVRGAAEGQGLGNAFLSHIKACDAIFNLCRKYN